MLKAFINFSLPVVVAREAGARPRVHVVRVDVRPASLVVLGKHVIPAKHVFVRALRLAGNGCLCGPNAEESDESELRRCVAALVLADLDEFDRPPALKVLEQLALRDLDVDVRDEDAALVGVYRRV